MKYIVIGDVHATEFKNDQKINNISMKLQTTFECLHEATEYAYKNDISHIIFAGDIFDKRDLEYSAALNMFYDFLNQNNKLNFISITGNHDISDNGNTPHNLLRLFQQFDNFELIDFNQTKILGNIAFVSYSNDILQSLQEVSSYGCSILISHLGINEAQLSSGLSKIDPIKFSDLSKVFKLMLLGHYHKPQMLTNDNATLYYVGSVIQKNWGEKDENKRFIVFDDISLNVESIEFTKYKKHIEIIIKTKTEMQSKLEYADQQKKLGNYVSVTYVIDSMVPVTNKEKKEIQTSAKEMNINISIKKEESENNQQMVAIDYKKDKIQIFEQYLNIKDIHKNEQEEYLKVIKDIISINNK